MPKKLGGSGNQPGNGDSSGTKDVVREVEEPIRTTDPPEQRDAVEENNPLPILVYSDLCKICRKLFKYMNSINLQFEFDYKNIDDLIRHGIKNGRKYPLTGIYEDIEFTPSLILFEGEEVRIIEGEDVLEFVDSYVNKHNEPVKYDPKKKNTGDPTTFAEDWKNADKLDDITRKLQDEESARDLGGPKKK
jgi:hypothetical protein